MSQVITRALFFASIILLVLGLTIPDALLFVGSVITFGLFCIRKDTALDKSKYDVSN